MAGVEQSSCAGGTKGKVMARVTRCCGMDEGQGGSRGGLKESAGDLGVGAGKESRGGFGRRSRSLRGREGDGGERWNRQAGPDCSEGRGATRKR